MKRKIAVVAFLFSIVAGINLETGVAAGGDEPKLAPADQQRPGSQSGCSVGTANPTPSQRQTVLPPEIKPSSAGRDAGGSSKGGKSAARPLPDHYTPPQSCNCNHRCIERFDETVSALAQAPVDSDFDWMEWWQANVGGLVAQNRQMAESGESNITANALPEMLMLLMYKGEFEALLRSTAIDGMRSMGPGGLESAMAIADGSSRIAIPKQALTRCMSEMDFEYAATCAMGYLVLPTTPGGLRKDALQLLSTAAQSPDPEKAFWAILSLGRIGDAAAIPVLESVIQKSTNPLVRAAAAQAACMTGGVAGVGSLSALLSLKEHFGTRAAAIASSILIPPASVRLSMKAGLNSPLPEARFAGALAICMADRFGISKRMDSRALHADFIHALKTEQSWETRTSMALGVFLLVHDSESIAFDLARYGDPYLGLLAAIALGCSASPDSPAIVVDPSVTGDLTALSWSLSLSSARDKSPVLRQMLRDANANLRAFAVMALCAEGTIALDDLVLANSKEPRSIVRVATALALGWLPDTPASLSPFGSGGTCALEEAALALAAGYRAGRTATDAAAILDPAIVEKERNVLLMGLALGVTERITEIEMLPGETNAVVRSACFTTGAINQREDFCADAADRVTCERAPASKSHLFSVLGILARQGALQPDAYEGFARDVMRDKSAAVKAFGALALSWRGDPENMGLFAGVSRNGDADLSSMGLIALALNGQSSGIREVLANVAKPKGAPVDYAARMACGLYCNSNVLRELLDTAPPETDSLPGAVLAALAIGGGEKELEIIKYYLSSSSSTLRAAAARALVLLNGLPGKERLVLCEQLSNMDRDWNAEVRFWSAV
ncbi:MAG: HEAT repeat domain-containing protein, partial [Candidatus Brocadiia bacterium]